MLARVADELGAGRESHLLLNVRAVGLHRADGEEELFGDLPVGVPERDQPQDVDLALGEASGGPGGGSEAIRAPSRGLR